jgi:NhaA family Na+:H+ antiporter
MDLHQAQTVAPRALAHAPPGRLRALARFFRVESAGGVLLLLSAAVALCLANSRASHAFGEVWQTRIGVTVGGLDLHKPLLLWVNDGLMTVFFFVVGMEIKRELVHGEMRDPRKAALPVAAAFGGMVVPAAVYLLFQGGRPGQPGWGIPMATDIAFVVGFLALLGPRVPPGLKAMLLSLAIVDDIGAVLVIAVFYSAGISFLALGLAGLGLAVTLALGRLGVRSVPVYAVAGAGVWLAFLKSGIHPTVAGVLLGLLTPASAGLTNLELLRRAKEIQRRSQGGRDGEGEPDRARLLGELRLAAREAVSPLERLESALHPWVAFLIMPVFALANAGVGLEPAAFGHPVALAAAAGLVLGKPFGIVLCSWLAVRAGVARLPAGVGWKVMVGSGCLAGIGFTMSLFIAGLALDGQLLDAGKIGTLTGSCLSAAAGSLLLLAVLPLGSSAGPARMGQGR